VAKISSRLFADKGGTEQGRIFYTKIAKQREAPLEFRHQAQEQQPLGNLVTEDASRFVPFATFV
jgi:hypothetical protein